LNCVLYIFEAVEEEECWRQYEVVRAGSKRKNKVTDANNVGIGSYGKRTKLAESPVTTSHCDRQAHMDDVEEVRPFVYSGRDVEQSNSSTFWLRKFDALESADLNRLFLTQFYCSTKRCMSTKHHTQLDDFIL